MILKFKDFLKESSENKEEDKLFEGKPYLNYNGKKTEFDDVKDAEDEAEKIHKKEGNSFFQMDNYLVVKNENGDTTLKTDRQGELERKHNY